MCYGISFNLGKLMKKPHCLAAAACICVSARVSASDFIHRVASHWRTHTYISITSIWHKNSCTFLHKFYHENLTVLGKMVRFFLSTGCHCERPLFIHIQDVNVIFWLLNEINLMSLFSNKLRAQLGNIYIGKSRCLSTLRSLLWVSAAPKEN